MNTQTKTYIMILVGALIILGGLLYEKKHMKEMRDEDRPALSVTLSVPSITQAPGGNWADPWGNACEEASAAMVGAYYERQQLPQETANNTMRAMFAWEKEHLPTILDTSAEQTKKFIEETTTFEAIIKRNPTLEEIKKEIRHERPVIALVNQFTFYAEPPTGIKEASYHVFVIIGYDDSKQQFIVNDPARPIQTTYTYDRLMNALHDLGSSGEADGPPTVLFTKS